MSDPDLHYFGLNDSIKSSSESQTTPTKLATSTRKLSTSFNAYPLECSSNFFNNENDVIFMPTGPTDLPLSVSPTVDSSHLASTFDSRLGSQPVCHGFFFPVSTAECTMRGQSRNELPDSVGVQQLESYGRLSERNLLPVLKTEVETRLLVLLLQQLISLQLTGRLPNVNVLDSTASCDRGQGQMSQTHQPSFTPAVASNKDAPQDMHTFLVPVEARLEDHEGLAFHVTPRDPSTPSNLSTEEAKLKMECATDRLVLYPYVTLGKSIVSTSPTPSFEAQSTESSQLPAATLTLNDLKQCIRRGSLEVTPNQHTNFVEDIKGQAKPGFALLSIRGGNIVPSHNEAPKAVIKSYSTEDKPVSSLPEHCGQVCPSAFSIAASRKGNKRKQRFSRSNTDPQKRSCKRNGRISAASVPNVGTPSTNLDLRQITVSRFRVSRFADKKQAWVAHNGSGCLVVHDLWTTKLPEYVLRRVDELKTIAACPSLTSPNPSDAVRIDEDLEADCVVCQGTLTKTSGCEQRHS